MKKGHNNPPFCTLDLNEYEHECLVKLFTRGAKQAEDSFKELCSMSSSDERARHRVLLTAGAMADKVSYEQLLEKLQGKQ